MNTMTFFTESETGAGEDLSPQMPCHFGDKVYHPATTPASNLVEPSDVSWVTTFYPFVLRNSRQKRFTLCQELL
ncbi:hypothetical protein [Rhizobium sp.]|uniref:hypothetical protein n=1 Tax=Rhizobium sp. TaxID=391 RepID=UPI003981C631